MLNRTKLLAAAALLSTTISVGSATKAQAADVWSPACTIDLIHMYPDKIASRCVENGNWYYVFVSDSPAGHIDRVSRALHAVELSGKKVQFHDVGQVGSRVTDRKFDILALLK